MACSGIRSGALRQSPGNEKGSVWEESRFQRAPRTVRRVWGCGKDRSQMENQDASRLSWRHADRLSCSEKTISPQLTSRSEGCGLSTALCCPQLVSLLRQDENFPSSRRGMLSFLFRSGGDTSLCRCRCWTLVGSALILLPWVHAHHAPRGHTTIC